MPKPSKLEVRAQQRIALAIRAFAKVRGMSHNALADEWKIAPATLDSLVGSERSPRAASIPRGKLLQLIAQRTGYSLDYLLGLSNREHRDMSRTATELETDLRKRVALELIGRNVRQQTVEAFLPTGAELLDDLVDDYARVIERLAAQEVIQRRSGSIRDAAMVAADKALPEAWGLYAVNMIKELSNVDPKESAKTTAFVFYSDEQFVDYMRHHYPGVLAATEEHEHDASYAAEAIEAYRWLRREVLRKRADEALDQ